MMVFLKLPEGERHGAINHTYSHMECDVEGCGEKSPPSEVLLKKGGLQGLGWYCKGGHHRCPKHFDTETPRRDPDYRGQ